MIGRCENRDFLFLNSFSYIALEDYRTLFIFCEIRLKLFSLLGYNKEYCTISFSFIYIIDCFLRKLGLLFAFLVD